MVSENLNEVCHTYHNRINLLSFFLLSSCCAKTEGLLVPRSNPPADQVSCLVTQTASLHLDEASPLNNFIEASHSTTDVTTLSNNAIISTVQSPTKKKRRTRKKNVAIASIQDMAMEPVQLIDLETVCLTNVTSSPAVLANPPKSRARKSGKKSSNCDSGRTPATGMSLSESKNPRRDLNSLHQKFVNAQSNPSPSKQVCILSCVAILVLCEIFTKTHVLIVDRE